MVLGVRDGGGDGVKVKDCKRKGMRDPCGDSVS